jgi:hypothetical protein
MPMTKCKACKNDIPTSAETCPICGIGISSSKPGEALKGFLIIFIIGFILVKCSSDEEPPTNNSSSQTYEHKEDKTWPIKISSLVVYAKPYSVIETEDYSVARRKRIKWFISAPDANTYETYLGTAIKAAKDLAVQNRVNQANIIIEPSPKLVGLGYNLAIVTYTVDGKGNAGDVFNGEYWQASATKHPPETLRVKVAEIWFENRSNFQNTDGMTDETRMIKFISSKLNIPESDVHMPWVDQVKWGM